MAIPPALRARQGCVASLPAAARPPLPRARHAVAGEGQDEEHGKGDARALRPEVARPTPERSKVR